MAKDGTNRGGRCVRASAKPGPLGEKLAAGRPATRLEDPLNEPFDFAGNDGDGAVTSQTMTLATVRCVPGRRCPNHRTICRRFSVTANRLALTSSIGRRGSGSINVAVPISWCLA